MNNSVKSFFFYLDQCFRRRCHFKDFLSSALASLLLAERNHLCNFGRGQYGEHSCESILYLEKWFRKTFKGKVGALRTHGGQRPIIIAHL